MAKSEVLEMSGELNEPRTHRWVKASELGVSLSGDPEVCRVCFKIRHDDGKAQPPCSGEAPRLALGDLPGGTGREGRGMEEPEVIDASDLIEPPLEMRERTEYRLQCQHPATKEWCTYGALLTGDERVMRTWAVADYERIIEVHVRETVVRVVKPEEQHG